MEINLDLRGALKRTSTNVRDSPSRSLSYSGCWTCRERRTKCDERPVTCKRCEDAKLVCGGYDIRLNWAQGVNRKRPRPGGTRRHIRPDRSSCQSMTDEEVTQALALIDKATPGQMQTTGPFSVFDAGSNEDQFTLNSSDWQQETPAEKNSNHLSEAELWNECQGQEKHTNGSSMEYHVVTSNSDRSALFTEEKFYEMQVRDPAEQFIEKSESHIEESYPREQGIPEIDSSSPSHDKETALQIFSPVTTEIPSNILCQGFNSPRVNSSSAAMLIHHYTNNIVHLMQPVSHKDNPFQTLYLPLAIEGSTVSSTHQNSISPATVAVFHSLICSAATNLQGLGSGVKGLQQLAFRHKERALYALRNSLERKIGRYKDLMIAILSLVSADILDGGTNDHWIHLDAAVKLQESRHHANLVSRETSQLNMICTMLRLFAQTALPYPEPLPWIENAGPDRVDHDFSDPSIEYIYGITTNLARIIKRIFRVTQHIAFYQGTSEYPAALLEACEELGDHLNSWKIDSEPFSAIGSDKDEARKVAQAQARAFHSAALIYYYRSVQNCRREHLSAEQEATLLAMNEAEDLKVRSIRDNSIPAPLTWPAFIASCEATGEYRQLWNGWWTRVERYNLKNLSKQHSIVQDVWERLDGSDCLVDWRDALVAMNVRVIPV